MKIRTKLRLNLFVVVSIIGAVVAVSVIGMEAIRSKLAYLTQRSAPFQMRTTDLQRAFQKLGRDLAVVSGSRNIDEYRSCLAHAEKSLADAKRSNESLMALSGDKNNITEEMEKNARDIFAITENRLKAETDAAAADKYLDSQLENCTGRLKELDNRIKKLQTERTSTYVGSLQETKSSSNRLREIETFKIALNELLYTVGDIQKATDRKGILLVRSRYNVALNKAFQSDYLKSSKKITEETKKLAEKVDELIKAKTSSAADMEAKSRIESLNSELGEKTSLILVIIDQEVNASREKYAKENIREGASFNASNLATSILINNAEFLSIGLVLEHLTGHLALATTTKDIDDAEIKLNQAFARASIIQKNIEVLIGKLGVKNELLLVRNAGGSLQLSKQALFAENGYISKVRKKIAMKQEADRVNARVTQQIDEQAAKGRETVSAAQGDQEKAITSVNTMSRNSITTIVLMGVIALAVGFFFALSLERAFNKPIRELNALAEEFGKGNFSKSLDEKRNDEFGELAVHFNQAGKQLGEMARQLTMSITSLATHSTQLSGTAEELASGARQQSQQTIQSASALTEMSQTITEVAGHAQIAADASKQAHDAAADGSKVVGHAVQGMEQISIAVEEAAMHIRELGASSEQIGSIVGVINDIADQTNLLALNAAIEAARAGEAGMGFAVVADEVRKLAHRTTEATAEIAATIRIIQSGTSKSVVAMEVGSTSVTEGVKLAKEARKSLDAIVDASGRGAEMVERIATAAEEQSATAMQVTASMENIANITRETEQSMVEVNNSSLALHQIANELSRMAEWFVTDSVNKITSQQPDNSFYR